MPKRKTHEEFVKEVNDIVGKEYVVLGEYKNAVTKIEFKHNKCGDIFLQRPSDFINGHMCKVCSTKERARKRTKTQEQFEKEVFELVGNEYEVKSKYINSGVKIELFHVTCSNLFEMCPREFVNCGQRCPKCFGSFLKTHEQFCEDIKKLHGDEYSVLSEYKGSRVKMKIKHNLCGHEYLVAPVNLLNNRRCPKCFKKGERKDTKTFITEMKKIYEEKFEVLSEYKTAHDKVLIKHTKCGSDFEVKPNHALTRTIICPRCDKSVGELLIAKFLEDKSVQYVSQKKFDECKNIRPLPFDFYIENKLLIEFDGEQHYREVDSFWGGMEGLKKRKINDEIKNNFAKKNGIPLIRIRYHEMKKIENILSEVLTKFGVLKSTN